MAEPEAPAPPLVEAAPAAADATVVLDAATAEETRAGSVLRAATTNISSLITSARTKAAETTAAVSSSASSLMHAASARLGRGRESLDGNPAAAPPPEPVPGATGTHPEQLRSAVNSLIEGAAGLTRKTKEGSAAAYAVAVKGLRRLTAPTRRVAAVVKADLRTKPCPQVLLLAANVVVSKGLHTTGLFAEPYAKPAAVTALAARLEDSMLLVPGDVDPALAAAVVKYFLTSLEEPLLTYRLADRWVAAGKSLSTSGDASGVPELLSDLPLVNWSTLRLLIEMSYLLASQFNVTGLNALAMATTLAPVLLWHDKHGVPVGAPGTSTPQSMVNQASQMAAGALQVLRSKLGQVPADEAAAAAAAGSGTGTPTAAAATGTEGGEVKKPHVVLDEAEESLLEQPVHTTAAEEETAAPAGDEATGAAGTRVVLTGDSLAAVVTLLEHLILNYEELFVMSG